MHVGKWGDSLAVRLPDDIVKALQLKEGDEIKLTTTLEQTLLVERKLTREEALARFRSHARPTPPDFKWSRDEANER